MIQQVITPPPTPPNSNDVPNFKSRADAFVAWIVQFVTQLTSLIAQINSTATTINEKESSVVNASQAVIASANFKGTWTAGRSTVVGESWLFEGIVYRVLVAGNTSPAQTPQNWVALTTMGTFENPIHANGGIFQDGHAILNGTDSWIRTKNATGWYNTTYDGGIYMEDPVWVMTYNNRSLKTNSNLSVGGWARIGAQMSQSHLYMGDYNEEERVLHCDSNAIGFLKQAGGWGSYCPDDGSWVSVGNITAYSDKRLKENVATVDNALRKVCALRGVYYTKIADETKTRKLGVIAQEVQEIVPEVVIKMSDDMLTVDYGNIVGLLIEAIKEQQKQIEELRRIGCCHQPEL